LATKIVFKELGCNGPTWKDVFYYIDTYKHYFYEYITRNDKIELCLRTDYNNKDDKSGHHRNLGVERTLPKICQIKKSKKSSEWKNKFQQNCKNHYNILKSISDTIIENARSLLPENLPMKQVKPKYVIDLYREKRNAMIMIPQIINTIGTIGGFAVNSVSLARNMEREKFSNSIAEQVLKNTADIIRLNAITSKLQHTVHTRKIIKLNEISSKIQNQSKLITKIQNIMTDLDYFSTKINYLLNTKDIESSQGMISQTHLEKISTKIQKEYGYKISMDLKDIITKITYDLTSYYLTFSSPILRDDERIKLYHITPLHVFKDNKTYIPIIEDNYIGITSKEDRYYPLLESEARSCIEKHICISSRPSYKDTHDLCGLSSFFKHSETCRFKEKEGLIPQFTSINNQTFFSAPGNITLRIICFDPTVSNEKENNKTISNQGYFELNHTCSIRIPKLDMIIKSVDYKLDLQADEPKLDFTTFVNQTTEGISENIGKISAWHTYISWITKGFLIFIAISLILLLIMSVFCAIRHDIFFNILGKRKFPDKKEPKIIRGLCCLKQQNEDSQGNIIKNANPVKKSDMGEGLETFV